MKIYITEEGAKILDEVLSYALDNLDMDDMEAIKVIHTIREQIR